MRSNVHHWSLLARRISQQATSRRSGVENEKQEAVSSPRRELSLMKGKSGGRKTKHSNLHFAHSCNEQPALNAFRENELNIMQDEEAY